MTSSLRTMAALAGLMIVCTAAPAQSLRAPPNCVSQTLLDVTKISEQVVLVGEVHGTQEIPAFTAGLVCSLLKGGRSVILALERDGNEQPAFNRYIESDGDENARRDLTAFYEWNSKCPDGRSSAAMLGLIEEMRRLRQHGYRVALVALRQQYGLSIPTTAEDNKPLSREDNAIHNVIADRAMADNLLNTAILFRQYVVVALAGSGHTTTIESSIDSQRFQPMGKLVAELTPTFIVGFSSPGGKHWGFGARGCGERELAPGALYQASSRINAVVELPVLTVSPPALQRSPVP